MRLFGKKRLTEQGVADGLVLKVSKDVYGHWESIREGLRQALTNVVDDTALPELSEAYAPVVIIAALFLDMQAFRNALPIDQFRRIQGLVQRRFCPPLVESELATVFEHYQDEWDAAVSRSENPLAFALAPVLYEQLDLPTMARESGDPFQSQTVLLCLTEVMLSVIGFCKFALTQYKIIPA